MLTLTLIVALQASISNDSAATTADRHEVHTQTSQLKEFGDRGTWLPYGSGRIAFSKHRLPFNLTETQLELDVDPGLSYFVVNNFAVGAEFNVGFDSSIDPTIGGRIRTLRFGVTPVLSYAVSIGRYFTIMPRVWLRYGLTRISSTDPVTLTLGRGDFFLHRMTNGLSVWLLLHITTHAYVGLAPEASYDFYAKKTRGTGVYADERRTTSVGGKLIVGAWF